MKITKKILQKIIKEEVDNVLADKEADKEDQIGFGVRPLKGMEQPDSPIEDGYPVFPSQLEYAWRPHLRFNRDARLPTPRDVAESWAVQNPSLQAMIKDDPKAHFASFMATWDRSMRPLEKLKAIGRDFETPNLKAEDVYRELADHRLAPSYTADPEGWKTWAQGIIKRSHEGFNKPGWPKASMNFPSK